ncbi:hypothetical protein J1N35_044917 [Gossypium stocksii]|uniref:RNase H type-1 domain-containing protein n=1 Tax=Gossypium stocksii TaxID=47602 RepID=A0A9D3UA23_9ROSI|nr:hypothetical protein J1N35_044917 [Gossypium stocksii]
MPFGFGFFGRNIGSLAVCLMTYQEDAIPSYGDPFLRCSPLHLSLILDKIIWGATSTGSFSLKSAYRKVELIGHVSLGSLHGVFGRIKTCSFFKALSGVLMRSLKSHVAGQTDGGCVRDYNGEWIIEFSRYLGNCIVLKVELWGILDGLNLPLYRCFERILIQIDSIEAINTIIEDSFRNSNSTIVKRIHHTLKKVKQWEIQHIPR